MGSQTAKNRAKQGGLHGGLNEQNISGAYIRSLVKQLTSCRSNGSPRGLKTDVPLPKSSGCRALKESSGNEEQLGVSQDSCNARLGNPREINLICYERNEAHKPDSTNPVSSPQQQKMKKQVRRRSHSRKTAQDCPLDIAEARRQIVTALHLHRAAASKLQAAKNQKPNNYSTQNSSSYNQSALGGMRTPATGCNSCMSRGATTIQKEAQAITICGHLLCWICLSEYLMYLSSSLYMGCPVCGKPLTANHIFPIALGVPIRPEHSAPYATTPLLLQSAPLLTNPLPQPSWSTTGPSLGIAMDGISSSTLDIIPQGRNNVGYISESPNVLDDSFDTTLETFTMAPENPKSDIASLSVKPEHENSMKSNWHVEMDEDELAEIRSLGEQHEMEWSDSVSLATSSWWFKFLKTSECNQDLSVLYQTEANQRDDDCTLENALIQDEMGFYPEMLLEGTLNNMNESLYFSSDPPVESLWTDERFECYDWTHNNEIEVYDNELMSTSEVLKINKSPFDEDLPDETCDLYRDLSSNNPVNKAGI